MYMELDNLKEKLMFMDLQLFAGEEDDDKKSSMEIEVVNGGYVGDEEEEEVEDEGLDEEDDDEEEEEELESEEDDEDEDDDSEEEESDEEDDDESSKDKKDKKTRAIIREKKARKEAERKLREAEEKLKEAEEKKEREKSIDNYIEKGYSEEEATKRADTELRLKRLERENNQLQFEKLEKKYPNIINYQSKIVELEKKLDLSKEEIYLAKFYKSSEYDRKTQIEQEMLYKSKSARDKASVKGADTSSKSKIKLSKTDEKAYKLLRSTGQFKDLTRKEYLSIIKGEIEE